MPTSSWFCFLHKKKNDCNARENNLKLVHLRCISLNYACEAMVFSKQPYSKGQNAFTRHHKNLLGSFKISLNIFLSNRHKIHSGRRCSLIKHYLLLCNYNRTNGFELYRNKHGKAQQWSQNTNRRNQSNMLTGTDASKWVYFITRSPWVSFSVSFVPTNSSVQN